MKITLAGARVTVVGVFSRFDDAEAARAALTARGATATTRGVKDDTSFVVHGTAHQTKGLFGVAFDAEARGLPILDEDQLVELLASGSLTLADAPPRPARALIGEARGLFDGPPNTDTWSALVELLDECAPDQRDELLDYVAPQVTRWPGVKYARWVPPADARVRATARGEFFEGLSLGTLRVAPPTWVMQGVAREDPRLRLVELVSLQRLGLSGQDALDLLERSSLSNLKSLRLHDVTPTKPFWKKAPALLNRHRVEELQLGRLRGATADTIRAAPEVPSLRKLRLKDVALDHAAFDALCACALTAHVEVLTFECHESLAMFSASRWETLPALREVELSHPLVMFMLRSWRHPRRLLERIERLSMTPGHADMIMGIEELARADLSGLRELDLTGANLRRYPPDARHELERARAELVAHLPGSRLIRGLERLRVGQLWSTALADALDGQVELIRG